MTIENFNEDGAVREINSPRTLEACLRVGLDPVELIPKSRNAFVSKDLTKQMIDIKYETFEKKRQDKIATVKAERSAIIQYTERKLKLQASNTSNTNSIAAQLAAMKEAEASNLLEIEIKRMEALKKRQEKEMNKMIEKEKQSAALQLKIKHAEAEEEVKKKMHLKKVAEQRAAAEKKANERLLELKRKEEEEEVKRKEVAKKEREFAEKMKIIALENERKIAREARERDMERTAKIQAYREKTEALLAVQAKLAEDNRVKMFEREQRVQAQLEHKKELKRIEVAEARAKAAKRIAEAKEKYNEIAVAKKAAFDKTQKEATIRAKENAVLEKEKIRKLADEREKKVRTRYGRLVDAYHKRTDHRQSIIDRRNEKDSTFGKIQEDRDNYTSMLKFSTALKLQDKIENVKRIARVNEFHRLQTLKRCEEADSRYDRIQAQRQQLIEKHREEVKSSLIRKHEIADAMETMRITNDFSILDKIFAKQKKGKEMSMKSHKGDEEEEAAPAVE